MKKKRVDKIMYAWSALVLLIYLADVGYTYIYFSSLEVEDEKETSHVDRAFQFIKAGLDLCLTGLIIY